MSTPNWRAAPLFLGHGPVRFEIFSEPTCPYSVKAQSKIASLLEAVGAHREEFVLVDHATGPNRDHSLNAVIRRIEALSGLALDAAFSEPALQGVIKWHARYGRQNGIHVSPTFMVSGVIQPQLGSGNDIATWAAAVAAV